MATQTDTIEKALIPEGVDVKATAGTYNYVHPLTRLATDLSTAAIDLLTNFTLGHRFKIKNFQWVTTTAGTGTSASQVFNIEINSTNLTGGVLTLLLADTTPIGKVTGSTAITGNDEGSATDTISIEMAASGTVFTAGAGYFVITIQNLEG